MNNNTIDSNLLRQIFFIAIIIFLGIVLFQQLWFFTSAFLGSVTFYVVMRDRMFFLTEKKRLEAFNCRLGIDVTFFFRDPCSNWCAG